MSPFLPPEILDLILDNLNDERTLKTCCLVSKPWFPCARRRLFFRVGFSSRSTIKSWTKAFPDPSTSPGHHTRSLYLCEGAAVDIAGRGVSAWVRTFCNVVDLRMVSVRWNGNQATLVSYHKLFPTLKSLSICNCNIPHSLLPGLIRSFPLLEDLRLNLRPAADTTAIDERIVPSTSPELTGTLRLSGDFRPVLPTLLGLPNGFRFSMVVISSLVNDSDLTRDLVLECSDTLESLSVSYVSAHRDAHEAPFPFDLSKATKLTDLEFQLHMYRPTVQWITTTLQTVDSPKLERIRIISHQISDLLFRQRICEEWRDLDRLLARLWTSHSIHPEIKFQQGDPILERVTPSSLPELAAAGAFDSVVS